jgi:tetratricopeptide (TPR) repeat protein
MFKKFLTLLTVLVLFFELYSYPFKSHLAFSAEEGGTSAEEGTSKTDEKPELSASKKLTDIDDFEKHLSTLYSSPLALSLRKAHEALSREDYSSALKFAEIATKTSLFEDYGVWLSAQAYRGLGQEAIKKQKYKPALKLLQKSITLALQIESNCPYSPFLKSLPTLLAQNELALGDLYWGLKNSGLALSSFERSFQRILGINPNNLLKPESLGHYATICQQAPSTDCVGWVKRMSAPFSKMPKVFKTILGSLELPNEPHHSFRNQARITTNYKSPDQDFLAYEVAYKLYIEEKFNDSAKAFEQILATYPRSSYRSRVRFWLGKTYSRLSDTNLANKILKSLQAEYPLTYYGLLASQETGVPLETSFDASLPLAVDTDKSLQPLELFHLRRAQNLIAEGAGELAIFELRDFKPRENLSNSFLLYLGMLTHKAKSYSLLFSILGELLQRGGDGILSAYTLHLIFPTDYFNAISKTALANKLDPILVMSLIKQESSFDKAAFSPVGAMGLMQLMPYTALETDPTSTTLDLLDPEANIRIGVLYLNQLIARYNGNMIYAVGAYNAGPNAMDRWIKAAPAKLTPLEFIESITYKETREYVSSIIRNYYWYSRRIKGQGKINLNYFWTGIQS